MSACRITFNGGGSVDVRGELQATMDELHRVATRREHTFAVLDDTAGTPVALRPEAVLFVRPLEPADAAAPPA